jgi:hypothetical protein
MHVTLCMYYRTHCAVEHQRGTHKQPAAQARCAVAGSRAPHAWPTCTTAAWGAVLAVLGQLARKAEIRELDVARGVQQRVLGLEVPAGDTPGLVAQTERGQWSPERTREDKRGQERTMVPSPQVVQSCMLMTISNRGRCICALQQHQGAFSIRALLKVQRAKCTACQGPLVAHAGCGKPAAHR